MYLGLSSIRRGIGTALATASAVVLLTTGGTAAASAAAPTAPSGHVQLTTRMAPGAHVATTIRVGAAECAALRQRMAGPRPGARPMARCVVGLGLAAGPATSTRNCGATGYWTTCYDKGTICFGDKPIWGGPNNSFSCQAEAYVSVDGRWKYRTPHNHKVYLLGQVRCPYAYWEGDVALTACQKRNNGHPILTMEAEFNWSGQIGPINGGGNGYIAIYAHYNGKVTLYGAWNTQ